MTLTTPQVLAETRESWPRGAEHVLAAGQFAAEGTIRLRPRRGGIVTARGVAGRHLAVLGDELVVLEPDGHQRSTPLTPIGEAAAFAEVAPGLRGTYRPATPADPDAPLVVDREAARRVGRRGGAGGAGAARRLADWYALGDAALRRFTEDVGHPQEPVLWPEHLDLGITLDEVNYGCSPGDVTVPDPYLYVSPHAGPPRA